MFLGLVGIQTGVARGPSVTETSLEVIQYTTSGPESQASSESTRNGASMRPIDKGLQPLYILTDGFLDLVHPSSKDDWIDDPRFDQVFTDGDIFTGLQIIVDEIQSDWKFWVGHYLGFTIVIAFGVTFIITMPIVGLVFCCCRLRGGCGAKSRNGKKNSDGFKRITLSILLIILTTLMTAGVVCMFMTNEVLRQQTSADQTPPSDEPRFNPEMGLLPAIVSSLRQIKRYFDQTFKDIKHLIKFDLDDRVKPIRDQIQEFPEKTREKLQTFLDPGKIFSAASSLSESLNDIAVDLGIIKQFLDALNGLQSRLNASLIQSKTNVLNALPSNCDNLPECHQLKNRVSNLNVMVDFSQSENATSQVSIVQSIINNDFQSFIAEGKMQFRNMSETVLNGTRETMKEKVNAFLTEFDGKLKDYVNDALKMVNETNAKISSALQLNSINDVLPRNSWQALEKVGTFRYYVGIGLSCVLLLVVVCVYLGLSFGLCGDTAGDGARFCNRGVGASFLLAGFGFTFVFASLLMTAAVVLFVLGGASYTEVCRPVLRQENKAIVKIGERILAHSLHPTRFRFTILSVLTQCENDRAIYEALNLGESFNVTGALENLPNLIRDAVSSLSGEIRPNFSSIVIARSEILDMLVRLQSVSLGDFRFSSFESSLSQPVINSNVSALADELLTFSRHVFLNATQRAAMEAESERLRNTTQALVGLVMNKTSELREFLRTFKDKIETRPGFPTFVNKSGDLMDSLLSTQSFLRTNLSGLISDYMMNYIVNISNNSFTLIHDVKHKMEHNVGRCRPVYDAFRAATVATCGSFLSPFNGFWFGILWCLFLAIPSLVVSVHLIGLYRRRGDDYLGNDSKSLDDPSQSLLRTGLSRTAPAQI